MASSSPYFYFATSQKATAVTHAAVGALTAPGDVNLVLGKANRLEIYRVTQDGLAPVYDVGLHGRIGTMNLVRVGVRARWRYKMAAPENPFTNARAHGAQTRKCARMPARACLRQKADVRRAFKARSTVIFPPWRCPDPDASNSPSIIHTHTCLFAGREARRPRRHHGAPPAHRPLL